MFQTALGYGGLVLKIVSNLLLYRGISLLLVFNVTRLVA